MEFRIHQRKQILGSAGIAITHGFEQPGNFSGTGIHRRLLGSMVKVLLSISEMVAIAVESPPMRRR
jgi:hypothetical protein